RCSASAIIARPTRSLTEPPGFIDSTLTHTVGVTSLASRRSFTNGVHPIDCRMLSCIGAYSFAAIAPRLSRNVGEAASLPRNLAKLAASRTRATRPGSRYQAPSGLYPIPLHSHQIEPGPHGVETAGRLHREPQRPCEREHGVVLTQYRADQPADAVLA